MARTHRPPAGLPNPALLTDEPDLEKPMNPKKSLTALSTAALLTLAACSGSDDDSTAGPTPTSTSTTPTADAEQEAAPRRLTTARRR